ncbi:STAS domain-containing protein [Streptomyces sp. NPDC048664]|uniref:STAS domain-containing protein n=1 Tax=Streptomyces sp. NPDC048664 TaxID=3154505 RepID=UPI00341C5338
MGDRVVVRVSGALDVDCEQLLHQTLSGALDRTKRVLELDLSGVGFCDCSALNVLLRMHSRAGSVSKAVTLTAVSPAVERLLALTNTLSLFVACPASPPGGAGREGGQRRLQPMPSSMGGRSTGDRSAPMSATFVSEKRQWVSAGPPAGSVHGAVVCPYFGRETA